MDIYLFLDRPSHNCGIHGIKPTTGRLSRHGTSTGRNSILGFLPGFVCFGPMARYISDLEYALEVLSGPDSSDPYTFIPPFTAQPNTLPKKIAYFWDDGNEPEVDDSIKKAIKLVIEVLKKEDIELIEDVPSAFSQASELMYRLCGYDNLEVIQTIEPSTNTIRKFMNEMVEADFGINTKQELEALEDDITLYKQEMGEFFEKYDALITPTSTFPALKPEQTFSSEYERGYSHFRFTYAWNVAEFPAMVVGSISKASSKEFKGLPVSIQIVVPPFKEDVAFSIAKLLEQKIELVSTLHPSFSKVIRDEL